MTKPIVIVGGGLGGLICAVRLASGGAAVRLLERSQELGGRARSPLLAGVPVNLGPHALYTDGPAATTLRALGVTWSAVVPPRADGAYVSIGGTLHPFPSTPWRLATSSWLTWREKVELARFLRGLDAERAELPTDLTVDAWLAQELSQPGARRAAEMLVRLTTYADAPERMPAAVAARQLVAAAGRRSRGVEYVVGGWQTLTAQLSQRAEQLGVRIERGATVTRVTSSRDVVMESGEKASAAHVIVALPRAGAASVLGWHAADATPTLPVRTACLDVVLDALPRPERRFALGLDAPLYYSVHSPIGNRTIVVHVAKYLAQAERGAEARDALHAWLAAVQPGFDAHVVAERFLPEMGTVSDLGRRLPALAPGVHVVGDFLGDCHLLDAVASSADAACARILSGRPVNAAGERTG